jgi:FixJ family two-component response regulator
MAQKRPQIAIIDDDESVRRAIRRLFVASNFDAEAFASGRAFLDSLPARRPDCVVLDLQMPGLNGIEMLNTLARAGLAVPVIIVTGHDEPESRTRCLAAGAVAYLCKPFDEAALLHAVGEAVGGRGSGRAVNGGS